MRTWLTDGGDVRRVELVVGESAQQTGLAHAGVPDEEQPEQDVVLLGHAASRGACSWAGRGASAAAPSAHGRPGPPPGSAGGSRSPEARGEGSSAADARGTLWRECSSALPFCWGARNAVARGLLCSALPALLLGREECCGARAALAARLLWREDYPCAVARELPSCCGARCTAG
ncbi:hypothetical protein NDU88_001022 [Pleurodeles waltl]|uniref:Uncharacterized protein n=1 Tax=Pleurodeles waltl TaxID=8319 RepID=A0AAV7MJR0_PLEWA|nr:hypothetical protein NDU88_001022 [Pleurodeles waltl]